MVYLSRFSRNSGKPLHVISYMQAKERAALGVYICEAKSKYSLPLPLHGVLRFRNPNILFLDQETLL